MKQIDWAAIRKNKKRIKKSKKKDEKKQRGEYTITINKMLSH